MLGPILQAIGNQIGPALNQLLQSATPLLQQVPTGLYYAGARLLSREIEQAASSWYHSLSSEARVRVDNAIFWAIKDLTGDVITCTTGIPLKSLVDKVFDELREYKDESGAEEYVESTLKKEIEQRSKSGSYG